MNEILLKGDIQDKLTLQEETILAYAYYAVGEQWVRMWAEPDTKTSE